MKFESSQRSQILVFRHALKPFNPVLLRLREKFFRCVVGLTCAFGETASLIGVIPAR